MTRTEFAPRMPFLQAWMDGKDVEWTYCVPKTPPVWQPVTYVDVFTYSEVQFRLKPQPREWWMCADCHCELFAALTDGRHKAPCPNCHAPFSAIRVREVLPDAAGGAA